MTGLHLSERDLQKAAESTDLLLPPQVAHLHSCPLCQGRVATYQLLFTATANLPKPLFDFNLAASVLAQLPQAKPTFPWLLSGVAALVLGVVSAFFILFGAEVAQALTGLSPVLGTALAVLIGVVVAGQGAELLLRHRRQMSRLNFS